jgi:hypothetical protein
MNTAVTIAAIITGAAIYVSSLGLVAKLLGDRIGDLVIRTSALEVGLREISDRLTTLEEAWPR